MKQQWTLFKRGRAAIGFGVALVSIGVLLSACARSDTPAADIEEVLDLVATSHTRWHTVQGQAVVVWTGTQGQQQEYVQDFAVSQPAAARFASVRAHIAPVYDVWMSDGAYIYEINTTAGTYVQSPLPAFALDLSGMENPETGPDPVAIIHPFSMLIPSPVAQYIYPHWFAQQVNGSYQLLGEEEWLGRKVWKVECVTETATSLAWVDQSTGVILRFQQPDYVDYRMTSIAFDETIDTGVFTLPADYAQE